MSQLSEQKKKKQLTPAEQYYHEQKIAEIESEFIAFQNELNNKQERVREWAERLDAIKEEKGILSTDEICAFICKRKDELNVDITDDWVRKSLDPKYKRGYTSPQNNTSIDSSTTVELPNITKIVDNAGLENAYEQADKVEEYARDLAKKARDAKAILEDKAATNHFQLPGKKAESTSTPRPESMETDLSDELLFLSEDILAVREKVIEFPPTSQDALEWAQGIRDFRQIFKGFTDLKYSKSIPEWFLTQITNVESGKHAAGVKHATMLPGGIKRNLTREQVGDNAEFILDAAWKALNSFDGLAGLIAWHKKYVEPQVAQRKVDLSPKLSELA